MGAKGSTATPRRRREVLSDTIKFSSELDHAGLILGVVHEGQTTEVLVPEASLTCGWLLSEVIRKGGDGVVALKTTCNNEAQDYWLLQYDRPLTPFTDHQTFAVVMGRAVSSRVDRSHFEVVKMIGKGGFSRVLEVRKKDSGELFAMKSMNKAFLKREHKIPQVLTERQVMARLNHPFIVQLKWAFQSVRVSQDHELHLVMDFCPGGELFFHLHNLGRFSEDQAKFYFGEIVLGLEHLHNNNIIYRDIKPENILLDIDGHVKLTDFGLAKEHLNSSAISYSFCGSPEYMSPEMLRRQGHGRPVDFYSLGALLFEMLTGLPPFYSRNKTKMYGRIQQEPLVVPNFVSDRARSLLHGLLEKDPTRRIGAQRGLTEVREHPWCAKIKWDKLLRRKILPPFRPNLKLSNFDPEYTSITITEREELGQVDDFFAGFDYDYQATSLETSRATVTQSFSSKKALSNEASTIDIAERNGYFKTMGSNLAKNSPMLMEPSHLAAFVPKREREDCNLDPLMHTEPTAKFTEEVKSLQVTPKNAASPNLLFSTARRSSPMPPRGGHCKQVRVEQPKQLL
jgi:serine/threonine protein kinase